MDEVQQKWLVRFILKDIKISLGHKAVLSAFHRKQNIAKIKDEIE